MNPLSVQKCKCNVCFDEKICTLIKSLRYAFIGHAFRTSQNFSTLACDLMRHGHGGNKSMTLFPRLQGMPMVALAPRHVGLGIRPLFGPLFVRSTVSKGAHPPRYFL